MRSVSSNDVPLSRIRLCSQVRSRTVLNSTRFVSRSQNNGNGHLGGEGWLYYLPQRGGGGRFLRMMVGISS